MRDLIISIVCLLCLMVPWGIYDRYSMSAIGNYKDLIDSRILPAIETENWQTAEKEMKFIAQDWDKYKSVSAYFTDTNSINEVDSMVSKVYYYVKCRDASNSAGEIASLKYCLNFLHENQLPSPKNIF
ncbi:MAG: DUF4363 family protein [Lentihominibacter sp.]